MKAKKLSKAEHDCLGAVKKDAKVLAFVKNLFALHSELCFAKKSLSLAMALVAEAKAVSGRAATKSFIAQETLRVSAFISLFRSAIKHVKPLPPGLEEFEMVAQSSRKRKGEVEQDQANKQAI